MDGKRVHIEFQNPIVLLNERLFFVRPDLINPIEDLFDTLI